VYLFLYKTPSLCKQHNDKLHAGYWRNVWFHHLIMPTWSPLFRFKIIICIVFTFPLNTYVLYAF